MNGAGTWALYACACASGGVAFGVLAYVRARRRIRAKRRAAALAAQGVHTSRAEAAEVQSLVLRYAEHMTRRLFAGATVPISPSVRRHAAAKTRAGKRYLEQSVPAGCGKSVSVSGFCEARTRMALAGAALGALIGACLTFEMAALLAVSGAAIGLALLPRAVASLKRKRTACAERYLSEMLEVVALGLRSGLTFDRSFSLYGSHFDNPFARECARAYRRWSIGLMTRDEALRDLELSFDCPQLSRIVDSILRGLRFGSAITETLEDAAAQSREAYRCALEERVAKAPVKMMLPTGTLILPAMLLLVMGPILLELAGGF